MFSFEMKFYFRQPCSADLKKFGNCGFYPFNEFIKGMRLKDETWYIRAFSYPHRSFIIPK